MHFQNQIAGKNSRRKIMRLLFSRVSEQLWSRLEIYDSHIIYSYQESEGFLTSWSSYWMDRSHTHTHTYTSGSWVKCEKCNLDQNHVQCRKVVGKFVEVERMDESYLLKTQISSVLDNFSLQYLSCVVFLFRSDIPNCHYYFWFDIVLSAFTLDDILSSGIIIER